MHVFFRLRKAALTITALAGVVGMVLAAPQVHSQVTNDPQIAAAQAEATAARDRAPANPAPLGAYRLQPGDDIEIRERLIPELNQTARVRPDGKISLLLVGDIDAAGLSAEQLAALLSNAYAKHYRNPSVSVVVRSFPNANVYVGGEVQHPGLVQIAGTVTALSAVLQAGGFTEASDKRHVILLREGNASDSISMRLNLEDVLEQSAKDTVLRPSDVIFVPKSEINVYVAGEVFEPGLLPLKDNSTALAAVFRARGFKPTANMSHVMLLRDKGDGKASAVVIDLKRVLMKQTADTMLRPYDLIYVPRTRISRADQFMGEYFRDLLPISTNAGFSYLLGGQILK